MSERVYLGLVQDLSGLLEEARRSSARAVNFVMTATYWEMGRRIVEFEQSGSGRAAYGTELLARLARDLAGRFREFYLHFPEKRICSTLSSKLGESAAGLAFYLAETLRGGWSVRQLNRQIATRFGEVVAPLDTSVLPGASTGADSPDSVWRIRASGSSSPWRRPRRWRDARSNGFRTRCSRANSR